MKTFLKMKKKNMLHVWFVFHENETEMVNFLSYDKCVSEV